MPIVGAGKISFQKTRSSHEQTDWGQGDERLRQSNGESSSRSSSRAGPRINTSKGLASGEKSSNAQRFSLVRSRWSSDPTLSARYRDDGERSHSPVTEGAPAPVIGLTAPPTETNETRRGRIKFRPFAQKVKDQHNFLAPSDATLASLRSPKSFDVSRIAGASARNLGTLTDREEGDHEASPPNGRRSESAYRMAFGKRNTKESSPSTNGQSTGSSLFATLKRKNKQQRSLFPLPAKVDAAPNGRNGVASGNGKDAASTHSPGSESRKSLGKVGLQGRSQALSAADHASLTRPPMLRHGSNTSVPSVRSSPPVPTRGPGSFRGRSNTLSSVDTKMQGSQTPPQHLNSESGRNSLASTTVGRNSIAGLRGLTARLRHPSDATLPRKGSPGSTVVGHSHLSSQNNSFAISRDSLVAPEREEGETAVKYYSRVEKDIPKRSLALVFSKKADTFSHDVLRSLMRTFKFYEDPMDISMRRFLWEIELPGEGQQIDRVITAFAERYYECNPHIFDSVDQATVVAFSMIMLHSDLFNKNNKHKMQRWQYQKNTGGQGIADEILGYFYDNIQYTEFIAQTDDDEDTEVTNKSAFRKARRQKSKPVVAETVKTGKMDPYDIILDEKTKMDILRPSLKDVLQLEDNYTFRGTADRFNHVRLQQTFNCYGILQIVSSQSKAYSSPTTAIDNDAQDARVGVIEIKVAKAGVLWRKDSKKRKTRPRWQEWGAILTSSSIFLFRNVGWVKSLVHQQDAHQKKGHRSTPVVFSPQLESFEPDVKVPTFHAVALQDINYKKHKYAFVLARQGNSVEGAQSNGFFEEVLLADNESETNDWIAKINYASTFQSQGITIRPLRLPEKKEHTNPPLGKMVSNVSAKTGYSLSSSPSTRSVPTENSLAFQMNDARKQMVSQRLVELDAVISSEMKSLEGLIRSARHLQILAPFPQKTRNDLLIYGARISYKLRWLRFEVWRLKCQKEILSIDADDEAAKMDVDHTHVAPPSPSMAHKSTLGRLSSKAGATLGGHRSSRSSKAATKSLQSPSESVSKESDLAGGIDEAFATPHETLSRMASYEGPLTLFTLPPLNLSAADGESLDSAQPPRPSTPRLGHQSSTSSLPSKTEGTETGEPAEGQQVSSHLMDQIEANGQSDRLSIAIESDREQSVASFRPESRSNHVRRSLHRTLRDSRDSHRDSQGSRSTRNKRIRDSMSTTKDDASSVQESENLSRGAGSFRIHGHKASVVNVKLGTEWQQLSPDERQRVRHAGSYDSSRQLPIDDDGTEAVVSARSSLEKTSFTTARKGSGQSESDSDYES